MTDMTSHISHLTCSSRFDENFSREYTKIKFVTEGILIREMMGDPLLSNYSVIMLDEVTCTETLLITINVFTRSMRGRPRLTSSWGS